ncbi:MAG: hypothetical protein ACYCTV_05840 [Leptospirales bacterium]
METHVRVSKPRSFDGGITTSIAPCKAGIATCPTPSCRSPDEVLEKSFPDSSPGSLLLDDVLPRLEFSGDDALWILAWYRHNNRKSRLSAKKGPPPIRSSQNQGGLDLRFLAIRPDLRPGCPSDPRPFCALFHSAFPFGISLFSSPDGQSVWSVFVAMFYPKSL